MPRQGYYEVMATVIPVFFIALAVGESRLQLRSAYTPKQAILAMLVVAVALAAGEVAAIRALLWQEDGRLLRNLTVVSLALALGFVVMYLVEMAYRDVAGLSKGQALPDWASKWIYRCALIIGIATVVALMIH